LATPPVPDDVVAAKQAAAHAHRLAAVAGTLDQLAQRAISARDGRLEARQAIEELGDVLYDRAAHQEASSALQAARHAAAEIKRIDMELRARPDYEATRQSAQRALTELAGRRTQAEAAKAEVGFDSEQLRSARAAETTARLDQQTARETATTTREARRDAELALRGVVDERDRLQRLAEEADRCGREADELERMYREFTEFDKYVADHVGPLLAETTERLLSQVTEGKYDRVRFDENYGIEVYDGDESFRLEGFSGGERDVVALCARLAMSELVGSAALRPPRFLVLDEVFGSLDGERRGQLLGTLGSLASSGHFQQVFIISHVDDVQQSHVMDEAWTVEEQDGVSRVIRPALLAAER
jgi:exonuclease SbcC